MIGGDAWHRPVRPGVHSGLEVTSLKPLPHEHSTLGTVARQPRFIKLSVLALGYLQNKLQQRQYLNSYGNLLKHADSYLVTLLDALDELGLTDDTLAVRTADHGEMGLSHSAARPGSAWTIPPSCSIPRRRRCGIIRYLLTTTTRSANPPRACRHPTTSSASSRHATSSPNITMPAARSRASGKSTISTATPTNSTILPTIPPGSTRGKNRLRPAARQAGPGQSDAVAAAATALRRFGGAARGTTLTCVANASRPLPRRRDW